MNELPSRLQLPRRRQQRPPLALRAPRNRRLGQQLLRDPCVNWGGARPTPGARWAQAGRAWQLQLLPKPSNSVALPLRPLEHLLCRTPALGSDRRRVAHARRRPRVGQLPPLNWPQHGRGPAALQELLQPSRGSTNAVPSKSGAARRGR
jgi:hypothetical protein